MHLRRVADEVGVAIDAIAPLGGGRLLLGTGQDIELREHGSDA
jgi:hypothetical protein